MISGLRPLQSPGFGIRPFSGSGRSLNAGYARNSALRNRIIYGILPHLKSSRPVIPSTRNPLPTADRSILGNCRPHPKTASKNRAFRSVEGRHPRSPVFRLYAYRLSEESSDSDMPRSQRDPVETLRNRYRIGKQSRQPYGQGHSHLPESARSTGPQNTQGYARSAQPVPLIAQTLRTAHIIYSTPFTIAPAPPHTPAAAPASLPRHRHPYRLRQHRQHHRITVVTEIAAAACIASASPTSAIPSPAPSAPALH